MVATIVFTAHINIDGDNIKETKKKWENMPLFSEEAKACLAECRDILAIEDENFEDIADEWNKNEEDDDDWEGEEI